MIFKAQEAHKIARDEKTQARRPINHYTTDKFGICRTKAERPHRVEIEHVEIRHGKKERRREEICVVNVHEVRRVRLGDLTPEDAKAEGFVRNGFGAPDLFFARWRELYGPPIGPIDERQEVWLISFDRERDGAVVLSHIIEAPYGDYTTKPRNAADDVEALTDPKLLARYAAEAQTHDGLRAQRRLDAYDIAQRYAAARAEGERLGVDNSHHERAIRERLARMERANQQRRAA